MKRIVLLLVAAALGWSFAAWAQAQPIKVQIKAELVKRVAYKGGGHWVTGGFSPNEIEVTQGQEVTLELTSVEGTHSLSIPAFGVTSAEVGPGQTAVVTFKADKPGEFAILCASQCGGQHEAVWNQGQIRLVSPGPHTMSGRLIVDPVTDQ
jgi:heme/copper-type cytochrome/quinol oxidase subunit 2